MWMPLAWKSKVPPTSSCCRRKAQPPHLGPGRVDAEGDDGQHHVDDPDAEIFRRPAIEAHAHEAGPGHPCRWMRPVPPLQDTVMTCPLGCPFLETDDSVPSLFGIERIQASRHWAAWDARRPVRAIRHPVPASSPAIL